MSRMTRRFGAAEIHIRRGLGEFRAEQVLEHPLRWPLSVVTGKEPWLMLPWFTPLRATRNAVHSATEQAYAQ